MTRRLLISGGPDFVILAFDTSRRELEIVAKHIAPFNASWTEPVSSNGTTDQLLGLSEGNECGLLYTFEIDHQKQTCTITSSLQTLGAPSHFIRLKDRTALVLGTYLGGSIALYATCTKKADAILLADSPREEVKPEFPYKSDGHGPNIRRQQQCHIHQILEDKNGLLYAPDLGSDRVWIFRRNGMKLDQAGLLQCPPGTGPRHAVFNPENTIMYVIGELSHTVIGFEIPEFPCKIVYPIEGFAANVIPATVHPEHQTMMDSAEICSHPNFRNVLYVSNRWERHIAQREAHLHGVSQEMVLGDAVAIILLSEDGRQVQHIKHVRTQLDIIRGMRVSDDGKYVVVAGQEGGGVEIYEIKGDRGELWTLAVRLTDGLAGELKHAIWI
ncbi:putative isomerase YbhE [Myriangium duriaei CBS 260.36]|uniref:Isomerase YbhE n=1 Tax=Myriangium duriaei CBS 260.36 TaxID=1168546 RepID=A0A9P4J723_9PEZI|nr:putative isomerase YbhE [Myriangium duriaei CBS 260.36]